MATIYHPEWRNENSARTYPFEDLSHLISLDAQLELRNSWLVDAAIYPLAGTAPYSLGDVLIQGSDGTLTLVDRNQQLVGIGVFRRAEATPIGVYAEDGVLAATLVPGPDANHALFAAGDGLYGFGPGRADLVASTVLNLSEFAAFYGFSSGTDQLNSSDLVLVGEYGVQLTVEQTQEVRPNGVLLPVTRVRLHAVGDPQALTRNCEDRSRQPARFIKEVVFQYGTLTHRVQPVRGGILMLAGSPSASDTALQIQGSEGTINIRLRGKSL